MTEQEKNYMNMVEVKVTVDVFDHYKGKVYRNDSRCFKTSTHCLSDMVAMSYDDNIDNMKMMALEQAINAVRRGYGR